MILKVSTAGLLVSYRMTKITKTHKKATN